MIKEFSKTLLVQESILLWIVTLAGLVLAFVCVAVGFTASLPWISTMVGLPWAAYGTSQAFYYQKSKRENTEGGIVFEKMKRELDLNGPI